MKHDLIERYIYAATKRLPRKNREDVAMELRGLIDDMLMERCGDETPTEKDIRVVLTEIGSPMEVYAKYDEDADKCLIGQPYYSTYKFVLKIVLASVIVGMTIVSVIQAVLEPTVWYELISEWIGNVSGTLVSAFTFVTILFVFFQNKGIRLDSSSNLDDLPSVPKKKQEISLVDTVVGLVLNVLFPVVFLLTPQIICAINTETGTATPVFQTDVIRAHWYFIVLMGVLGIVDESVKLLERRYNRKVMCTTIVANALSALTAFCWLSNKDMLNPEFLTVMNRVAGEDAVFFEHFPSILLGILLFALMLETIDTVVKTLRK